MSNRGAILSSSFVNALRGAAGEAELADVWLELVEYLRALPWTSRDLPAVNPRRVAEHRKTLLAIITPTRTLLRWRCGLDGQGKAWWI
jgi:hypothetical protein